MLKQLSRHLLISAYDALSNYLYCFLGSGATKRHNETFLLDTRGGGENTLSRFAAARHRFILEKWPLHCLRVRDLEGNERSSEGMSGIVMYVPIQ